MKLDSLKTLFVDELIDLYSAEQQITQALPKLAQVASNQELKQAFEFHLEQTRGQLQRLDQIFEKMKIERQSKTCKGMQGILAEAQEDIRDGGDPDVIDACLISSAQRVEHYEIAAYGSARTYAELLGDNHCVQLLEQTLDEEKQTDAKLTQVAQKVNVEAKAA